MAITEKAKIMLLNKGILVGKKNDDWKKNNAIINLALNIRVEKGEELLTEENVFEVEKLFGYGQVTEPFYRGFPASVKRIGLEEKEIIAKYAEENDLSMSQVIRRAIKQFLKDIKED